MRGRAQAPVFFLLAFGQAALAETPQPVKTGKVVDRYTLVEEFTADTLAAGEVQIGTDLNVGLTHDIMFGTDLVAAAIGATTLEGKFAVWHAGEHEVSLGLRGAYLNRETALWGSLKENFDKLDARLIRPSVSWTNTLSPRLKLHTFWAKGFGTISAELSEKGKRALWQTKHPGADYDTRDKLTQAPSGNTTASADNANQEKTTSQRTDLTQKSIDVQSITGLAQERFQMTGEYNRASGNKVLMTCRVEQTELEGLKSNFFRLTAAHQWIWQNFQMRLGVGAQYFVLSGHDLDGEQLDEAGWAPASDISFYWRF